MKALKLLNQLPCQLMGIVLLSGIIINAQALNIVPQKSNYYYQLNGGSDLSAPRVNTNNVIAIGGGLDTNLSYTCNIFNPAVTIRNTMNDFAHSVEGLAQSVIGSATAAIGSLPMYALQKTSPEMYNMIQNGMMGGQEKFNVSLKSCQQSLSQIRDGKSPYQDWFSISDSQGWFSYSQQAKKNPNDDSKSDVTTADKNLSQTSQKYGMPWTSKDKNAGGENQNPIKVPSDIVMAGYNILDDPNRPLDSNAAPTGNQAALLKRFWDTPDAAAQWSQLVLGDYSISSDPKHANDPNKGGIGLSSVLTNCPAIGHTEKTCTKTLQDNIWALVKGQESLSPDNLRAVSASNLNITPDVIQAIQNQSNDDQLISVSKLAEEVSIQNIMDEALLLRQLLSDGEQSKAVYNIDKAKISASKAIVTLDKQIHDMQFVHQVRKDMMTHTATNILQDEENRITQAKSETGLNDTIPLHNGAAYKQN